MSVSKKHIGKLIIIGAALFIAIFAIGLFFAQKSVEPVYRSKIDQIMFDRENKSPRYVITLPDKEKISRTVDTKVESFVVNEDEEADIPTVDTVMKNVPNINSLTAYEGNKPLKYIESIPALTEESDGMSLPIKSKTKSPWVEYSNPVDVSPDYFKVAIVINNMGLDTSLAEKLAEVTPSYITFSFSPYARDLPEQIKNARSFGHETYLDLLLLSKDFMRMDTGPKAIKLTNNADDVVKNFNSIINVTGAAFGGIVIDPGVSDAEGTKHLQVLLENIRDRGLLMLDATDDLNVGITNAAGLVRRKVDVNITNVIKKEDIKAQLARAEDIAMEKGSAVIIIEPKPLIIMAMKEWADTFSPQMSYEEKKRKGIEEIDRPFALVPLSAVVAE